MTLGHSAGMTTLIAHEDCADHLTPEAHPEQVARLKAVLSALADLSLDRESAPHVTEEALLRVHPRGYLDYLKSMRPETGQAQLDPDTWMSPGSLDAASRAAGAAVRAVDAVVGGDATNAFCATRPPGHHAEREKAMGFCLYGNVAVAAKHALDHHGLRRVAIADFDVHHGNGTQDLVAGDDRILFISSHQVPHYPGTGQRSAGNALNIPLAPGTGGAEARVAWQAGFAAIADHDPELIIVSAGFDAHAEDPLGDLNWSEADFTWITGQLCDLAESHCAGKLVSVLEGGYDLSALGRSVRAHFETLIQRSAA